MNTINKPELDTDSNGNLVVLKLEKERFNEIGKKIIDEKVARGEEASIVIEREKLVEDYNQVRKKRKELDRKYSLFDRHSELVNMFAECIDSSVLNVPQDSLDPVQKALLEKVMTKERFLKEEYEDKGLNKEKEILDAENKLLAEEEELISFYLHLFMGKFNDDAESEVTNHNLAEKTQTSN